MASNEELKLSKSTNLPSCRVNVESTDEDNSFIDDDNDEDKCVKSVLTWSNDDDTDCDKSLIDDDTEDDKSVKSVLT